ncbi:MAG: VacJ family lipoprotein [Acidobacteriota bacterium]
MKIAAKGIVTILLFLLFFQPAPQLFGLDERHPLAGTAMAAAAEPNDDEEQDPFAAKSESVKDPLEGFNRAVFKFNDKLYFWFIKPVAQGYSFVFPAPLRKSIRNGFTNILVPVRFTNCLLQGKVKGAGVELARFTINSTIGVGGLFDVAGDSFKLTAYDEDLGQTLGAYGLGHGMYLVLPFFGPSSARDAFGMAGDSFLDPIYYMPIDWYVSASIKVGKQLNNASLRLGEYEDFKQSAVDPYVSMRHAYIQYRSKEVAQ